MQRPMNKLAIVGSLNRNLIATEPPTASNRICDLDVANHGVSIACQ